MFAHTVVLLASVGLALWLALNVGSVEEADPSVDEIFKQGRFAGFGRMLPYRAVVWAIALFAIASCGAGFAVLIR